ncbi:MAG TPA: hypothetical protein VFI31_02145 [Pirellulales bacterium]|nr:hypothetical protein [Pirellulales bacterium]
MRNWEKTYRSSPHAAICEATFWKVLADRVIEVEPNEELTGAAQRPDYRCKKDGQEFYVEVTCVLTATASKKTALSATLPDRRLHPFDIWGFNRAVNAECQNKVKQCANLGAPCLLAIGTFHSMVSTACVKKVLLSGILTGDVGIGWKVDPSQRGESEKTNFVTDLQNAAFLYAANQAIQSRRSPLSGLLIGGFGVIPWRKLGILHPKPIHEFDTKLLDDIEFCRLQHDLHSGLLKTKWSRR